MLFTARELTRWLGITVLELFIFLVAATITSVLVMLRLEGAIDITWLVVLSPLFVSDALNAYFCVIVLIRMHLYDLLRPGMLRAMWSTAVIGLSFIFKFLLWRKLHEPNSLGYSAVLAPIFIMMQLFMIRACHIRASR